MSTLKSNLIYIGEGQTNLGSWVKLKRFPWKGMVGWPSAGLVVLTRGEHADLIWSIRLYNYTAAAEVSVPAPAAPAEESQNKKAARAAIAAGANREAVIKRLQEAGEDTSGL